MKKSKDLIGSPVISIADGMQVGEVKSLVIEPKAKRVEFFILSENEEDVIKAIPFARAEAVGDYAVTIGQMADILDLKSINVAQHLLENECKIIGAKVISNKGQLLGVVVEYGINPDTGEITTYFYNNDYEEGKEESEQSLDAEQVITIGRDMIIVQDN
ncbi:MAG: photosystem reaction center subunit H, partial [Firmicutes bacterium]|nr:photosystem reaction center subunit H [Bacillota bacterium]